MSEIVINELRATLAKMEMALGRVNEGIVWTDSQGLILWCNAVFDQFVGLPHIIILNKMLKEVFPLLSSDLNSPCSVHPVERALKLKNKGIDTFGLVRENQVLVLEVSWSYFSDQKVGNDHKSGCVLTIRDVTERHQAEIALRESKQQLEHRVMELQQAQLQIQKTENINQELRLLENILDVVLAGYWDWQIRQDKLYLSPGLKEMLGYDHSSGEIAEPKTWQSLIFGEDLPKVKECFDNHVNSGGKIPFSVEARCRCYDGHNIWVICSGKVIEWDNWGKPLRVIGCHINISERKQAEEQLKDSLREKEVLIKEIHHRVKNNLLVVSSLIDWQSEYVQEDQKLLKVFTESQKRINTMALIHEKLYGSPDLAKIDLAEYLETLIEQLQSSSLSQDNKFKLDVEFALEPIFVNIETATPCGLIINELFANALEHAFIDRDQGKISLNLSQNDQQEIILIVEDNGIGFPDGINFYQTESLGLQLVCLLAEQLEGKIKLDNSSGTKIVLIFSELNYNKRI